MESGTIRLTDRIHEVDDYLPREERPDIRWVLLYLSWTIVGVVIFVVGLIDVSVFAVVSVAVSEVIILVLFGSTAIIHYYLARQRERRLPIELATEEE